MPSVSTLLALASQVGVWLLRCQLWSSCSRRRLENSQMPFVKARVWSRSRFQCWFMWSDEPPDAAEFIIILCKSFSFRTNPGFKKCSCWCKATFAFQIGLERCSSVLSNKRSRCSLSHFLSLWIGAFGEHAYGDSCEAEHLWASNFWQLFGAGGDGVDAPWCAETGSCLGRPEVHTINFTVAHPCHVLWWCDLMRPLTWPKCVRCCFGNSWQAVFVSLGGAWAWSTSVKRQFPHGSMLGKLTPNVGNGPKNHTVQHLCSCHANLCHVARKHTQNASSKRSKGTL